MRWLKFFATPMLTENEIYFSAPLNIDEQHECNLETDYDSVTEKTIYDFAFMKAPEFGYQDMMALETLLQFFISSQYLRP